MLNGIILFGYIYGIICVVVGVVYVSLYGFWSFYYLLTGKGDKVTELQGSDIGALFFFLIGNLIIKSIKLHRKFRHYVEIRRRKKIKNTVSRLSH